MAIGAYLKPKYLYKFGLQNVAQMVNTETEF
jgi:hypothetical protein